MTEMGFATRLRQFMDDLVDSVLTNWESGVYPKDWGSEYLVGYLRAIREVQGEITRLEKGVNDANIPGN